MPHVDDDLGRASAPETDTAVRAVLCQDYERLERQLQTILIQSARQDPIALRIAWQTFESELVHHCDDEDIHILPAFAKQKPIEAQALLAQHDRIRTSLGELRADLNLRRLPAERLVDFVGTLREHFRCEDDLLYLWAAHWLEDAARERVRQELSSTSKVKKDAAEEWAIDVNHSNLRFSLRHVAIHDIEGRFRRWGGTILLNNGDLAKSSVHVWVDLASIDTGALERDAQIRSPEYLDVGHFRQATFVSSEVRLQERANPTVKGRLSLHGFTEDVDLEITHHNRWSDGQGSERVSYEVTSRLDRRRFGLRWDHDLAIGGVGGGDEIEIVAKVEAILIRPADDSGILRSDGE